MTNTDRQKGHEITGECWHTEPINAPWGVVCSCGMTADKNPDSWGPCNNRTFTTPDDAYALEQALVRDKLWDRFNEWVNDLAAEKHLLPTYSLATYGRLLAEQRCQLIIDFYKERNA